MLESLIWKFQKLLLSVVIILANELQALAVVSEHTKADAVFFMPPFLKQEVRGTWRMMRAPVMLLASWPHWWKTRKREWRALRDSWQSQSVRFLRFFARPRKESYILPVDHLHVHKKPALNSGYVFLYRARDVPSIGVGEGAVGVLVRGKIQWQVFSCSSFVPECSKHQSFFLMSSGSHNPESWAPHV